MVLTQVLVRSCEGANGQLRMQSCEGLTRAGESASNSLIWLLAGLSSLLAVAGGSSSLLRGLLHKAAHTWLLASPEQSKGHGGWEERQRQRERDRDREREKGGWGWVEREQERLKELFIA